MKKNNGITLIALVITIIVLLILAGVSIAMITSQDGILGKSKAAKAKNEVGAVIDEVTMKLSEYQADFYDDKYVQEKTTTDDATLTDVQTYVWAKMKTAYPSGNKSGVTFVEAVTSGTPANAKITITSSSDTSISATAEIVNGAVSGSWKWSK